MRSLMVCTTYPKIFSGYKIEKNEMDGACSACGERSGLHRVLVGKPEEKRPLGKARRRWKDNIKIYL
jgi:hypothetical protein